MSVQVDFLTEKKILGMIYIYGAIQFDTHRADCDTESEEYGSYLALEYSPLRETIQESCQLLISRLTSNDMEMTIAVVSFGHA